jgi:hypothetical protein
MANIKHSYAVYNSCGQFQARFHVLRSRGPVDSAGGHGVERSN